MTEFAISFTDINDREKKLVEMLNQSDMVSDLPTFLAFGTLFITQLMSRGMTRPEIQTVIDQFFASVQIHDEPAPGN